jgi:hypothetical protein
MNGSPWRRRLPRVRHCLMVNADTGRPVRVQKVTLWGRIVHLWELWRTPR